MSQSGALSSGSGAPQLEKLTGNTGGAVSPDGAFNINILGTGVAASGTSTAGNIYVTGTPGTNTLTVSETQAQYLTNYTAKAFADSPYSAALTDYYISINSSGGAVTVRLPNAPTTYRMFVVKDRTGNCGANNVTITTVGGVVLIDGSASYLLNTNYESATLVFNGTSYEVL